jgi:uncharacterized protein YjbI with pentapeptide repeats
MGDKFINTPESSTLLSLIQKAYVVVSNNSGGDICSVLHSDIGDFALVKDGTGIYHLSNAGLVVMTLMGKTAIGINITKIGQGSLTFMDYLLSNGTLQLKAYNGVTLANLQVEDAFLIEFTIIKKSSPVSANLNFEGLDLSGLDFSGLDLTRANLTDTNLAGANLAFADLTGAQLIRTNLTGCNLTGANLSYLECSGDLTDAILVNAKFLHTELTGNIANTDCRGTNFTGATMPADADTKDNFIAVVGELWDQVTTIWTDGLPMNYY